MYLNGDIGELNAEAFLELLYPERSDSWVAYCKGLFYRNYSKDILSFNPEKNTVALSRSGLLRYLPSEMISPESELAEDTIRDSTGKKKSVFAKDVEIRRRLQLLEESFVPFDSLAFRAKLDLEHRVEEILSLKMSYILKEFYDFDFEAEQDEYVRKAALLLPFIVKMRGIVNYSVMILESLTGHKVSCRYTTYGESDNTRCDTRKVFIDVLITGLTSVTYETEMKKWKPLFDFIIERFIPLDLMCDISIKGVSREQPLLDYYYYI